MAVAKKQVEVAVVIVVEEFLSHTAEHHGAGGDAEPGSDVGKGFVAIVVVQRKHFVVDVGNEEIDPAILVVVAGVNSHA